MFKNDLDNSNLSKLEEPKMVEFDEDFEDDDDDSCDDDDSE